MVESPLVADRPSTSQPRALRVASVPTGHVYVQHLSPVDGAGPERLPDPPPLGVIDPPRGQWWPPAVLDPTWIEAHDVDLVHVHFGFDSFEPDALQAWVDALRRRGTPWVYTVHDLRNPHFAQRARHDAQLDVLVPAADALLTLTPGAATEIARRWGREAHVVPHPHVVPLAEMERRAGADVRTDATFRVGVHLKSLRASMAPERVLGTLVETVAGLPDAVLQVNAHPDVLVSGGPRHDPALAERLRAWSAAGRLDLRVHDYLDDDALWDYLAGLDVSVLPYRFGTHSGWLEACRDLGTTVVAPTCGYLAEQGPVLTYGHHEDHYDADSLAEAVRTAHAERPRLGTTAAERRTQRARLAETHEAIYRSLVGR